MRRTTVVVGLIISALVIAYGAGLSTVGPAKPSRDQNDRTSQTDQIGHNSNPIENTADK